MTLDKLYTWHEWQYLPTLDRLLVFDKTGQRVAEWYIGDGTFHQLVNTLPVPDRFAFTPLVGEWVNLVNTCLKIF